MSTLTSKPSLETKKSSQDKAKTQQPQTNMQYLDEQTLERSLERILNQHNAVFEALKNR